MLSPKACGSRGTIAKGREIHAEIVRKGLERDSFIGNTLVDMYAKCGSFAKACALFDKLPVRDVVSWTAIMAGYAEQGLSEEGLDCLEQMQLEGVSPNAVTYACGLKACGSTGAIFRGREVHTEIAKKGLETDPLVGNALVDMYAKCGSIVKAQEVFDKLPVRDVVSWNILVTRYAQLGESEVVFHMLGRMRGEHSVPNGITFLSILAVCNHAGLVDKGENYFEAMGKVYGVTPTIEHYTCMVDLLGRAGQLDEAAALVEKMPFRPSLVVWNTLLGACSKWGNVEVGRWAFKHAVQLDVKESSAYVLMSNIYADAEDEKKFESMRVKERSLWLMP